MAGLRPSPWTSLLLAALLSVSFPGQMGESGTPLQQPSGHGHPFQGCLPPTLTWPLNEQPRPISRAGER